MTNKFEEQFYVSLLSAGHQIHAINQQNNKLKIEIVHLKKEINNYKLKDRICRYYKDYIKLPNAIFLFGLFVACIVLFSFYGLLSISFTVLCVMTVFCGIAFPISIWLAISEKRFQARIAKYR
jgi:hypothetical protein